MQAGQEEETAGEQDEKAATANQHEKT